MDRKFEGITKKKKKSKQRQWKVNDEHRDCVCSGYFSFYTLLCIFLSSFIYFCNSLRHDYKLKNETGKIVQ